MKLCSNQYSKFVRTSNDHLYDFRAPTNLVVESGYVFSIAAGGRQGISRTSGLLISKVSVPDESKGGCYSAHDRMAMALLL
jgi:hypothetical protein